jgi:hypothetical protein
MGVGKTITFTLDADTPLSADEQAMLARLAAMPDSDIDCSDIPSSRPAAQWTRPGSFDENGESFGVQPELLRLEDSISALTGMDSWRLGKGQEDFESWLRERGISKFEKMPSTVGELINVVVPKMSGSGAL